MDNSIDVRSEVFHRFKVHQDAPLEAASAYHNARASTVARACLPVIVSRRTLGMAEGFANHTHKLNYD